MSWFLKLYFQQKPFFVNLTLELASNEPKKNHPKKCEWEIYRCFHDLLGFLNLSQFVKREENENAKMQKILW